MKNVLKNLILVAVLVAMNGCATSARRTALINRDNKGGHVPKINKTHHFFMGGIGQSRIVFADQICGGSDKIVKIEAESAFSGAFLSSLIFWTYWFYQPISFRVYCSK